MCNRLLVTGIPRLLQAPEALDAGAAGPGVQVGKGAVRSSFLVDRQGWGLVEWDRSPCPDGFGAIPIEFHPLNGNGLAVAGSGHGREECDGPKQAETQACVVHGVAPEVANGG